MFYYLPNKCAVDFEGAVDAMLDGNSANRYFLDVTTGDVGCVEVESEQGRQKINMVQHEAERYLELPRVPQEKQEEWMRSFIQDCISIEDAALGVALQKELLASGFQAARVMLESSKNDSSWSWRGWAGDCAFEELGTWLKKNVPGVTYEMKGCEDCAICRVTKNGVGLQGFLDAFDEQRRIDEDDFPEKRETR